jgi:hypothetical protein
VSHGLIVERRAGFPSLGKQLGDRVDAHVRKARGRAHRSPLAQHGEDLSALGDRELVCHAPHYLNFFCVPLSIILQAGDAAPASDLECPMPHLHTFDQTQRAAHSGLSPVPLVNNPSPG